MTAQQTECKNCTFYKKRELTEGEIMHYDWCTKLGIKVEGNFYCKYFKENK